MNEGDSAGGGHQGLGPAPPAVPDRRSTIKNTISITSQSGGNIQFYQQTQHLNQLQTQQQSSLESQAQKKILISGSAVSSSSGLSQQRQHQHMTSRYSANQNILQRQPRIVITQIQQNQQQQSTNSLSSYPIGSNQGQLIYQNTNIIAEGNSTASSGTLDISNTTDNISAKRLKIDLSNNNSATTSNITSTQLSSSSSSSSNSSKDNNIVRLSATNDISIIKKRILEHKYLRLKSIKEKYSEHVAELFFLQSGGNMMEYPVWRKKPPTPQFLNFSKAYRLDGLAANNNNETTSNIGNASSPQGTEIKIPGVGATPIALSTQLPAAVVQLTQQGHIPGRPQGGRHGMVFGQISHPPAVGNITPLVPGGKPLLPETSSGITTNNEQQRKLSSGNNLNAAITLSSSLPVSQSSTTSNSQGTHRNGSSTSNNSNGSQEFSVKAKQEVYVMQRISELQREGLWTEKRLPKLQEPSRPKAHWDYLLEEMVWLSADFAQERKWKKAAAKKCARMVQKYFQDKANAAQKAEKAQELHLKRVAAFIAKEIKIFWSSVEKLVEYKHTTKLEEKRKKALDQHLSFIVDQTEKFSKQLAEGMNKTVVDNSTVPSLNSSTKSSPKRDNFSDDEFRPLSGSEDDEETIAKAEAEAVDVKEEIAALKKESEMDLEDFLKELPKDYLQNRDKILSNESGSEHSDVDDEFHADAEESGDDEDTIQEQEINEKNIDHKKEIEELNAENEMSIDELMVKYGKRQKLDIQEQQPGKMDIDSDDDEEINDSEDSETIETENENNDEEEEEEETEKENSSSENEYDQEDNVGLRTLLEEENKPNAENKDDLINDAAALAESIQPKGNTLSSTNVVTPVPFLLKHNLREYQHIGLDWLVTMHDRKLNGILADEMGLGKTIQTIALLAHLACVKGNWGPHLIVVPSSVMLNWEMEFKKWCPSFKILTYYGTQKERKQKRIGWTKPNAFHVCITSYKLVTQDQQSFRRKKWKYLILDEAQNIKNFKSQRWQLLLNFSTEQRLLLTGTPLQNNLMELWSLMHFLMPHVFQSHREFKEWFSNPMTGMIEGNSEYNESIIKRLHKVLRPFLLRRLKSEVEKQMPKKYEHVVMCRLSKRQRYLYDDFMSRAKTKETLSSGNLLSVINVLMQLRKVCNHPNLFEVRPTISPFQMERINMKMPSLIYNIFHYNPFKQIDLNSLNLSLIQLEFFLTAYVSYTVRKLQAPKKLIEEIDSIELNQMPKCPSGKYKFHIRIKNPNVQDNITNHSKVNIGTSPVMKTVGNKLVPVYNPTEKKTSNTQYPDLINQTIRIPIVSSSISPMTATTTTINRGHLLTIAANTINQMNTRRNTNINDTSRISGNNLAHFVQSGARHIVLATTSSPSSSAGQRIIVSKINQLSRNQGKLPNEDNKLVQALAQQLKNSNQKSFISGPKTDVQENEEKIDSEFVLLEKEQNRKEQRLANLKTMANFNQRKCRATPIYGEDFRNAIGLITRPSKFIEFSTWHTRSYSNCLMASQHQDNWTLTKLIKSYEERTFQMKSIFDNFVIFVPPVSAPRPDIHVQHVSPSYLTESADREYNLRNQLKPIITPLHPIISAMNTQFPDPRLIQYDCGKLQTLNRLLRQLKTDNHRVLIFTQMTKMLDVLEAFLNYHGHIYLRLDGSTKIEQRQILMERFNGDKRIFVFILSTRSGGVGVNLTGADTVIFYDSDWNPTMDAQAQDRCHRIGQTRDVHIYRLISEKTIEENILKKANQKRLLGDLAIEGGNFTTAYFKSSTIQDLFRVENGEDAKARLSEVLDRDRDRKQRLQESFQQLPTTSTAVSSTHCEDKSALGAFENALAAAEDEQDVQAAKVATAEVAEDLAEFDENLPLEENEKQPELSKVDLELENLVKQLSPIERYAMKFVEETGGAWTAAQLQAAEAEIEQQKREWEANRLAALVKQEEEMSRLEAENEELLTYSREDAKNQIWISDNTMEQMPMWCPPTPPQNDNDIYIDYSLSFLYETEIMSESHLPPVYVKKEYKRSRSEAGFLLEGRRPAKIRKEDNYYAPRSLFDRPSPAVAKIRRDLKIQRYRGLFKPNIQIPGLKQPSSVKPLVEPEGMPEWSIYEDIAVLHALQNLEGLPLNLLLLSVGHTPNWDLVAEFVNIYSRTYRSPKQCRWRYEAVIVPREEGKLPESPKKQKKIKNLMKSSIKGGVKSLRTSYWWASDNNASLTKLMKLRFDNIKAAYLKKAPPPKQIFNGPSQKNSQKHASVLQEFGIINYDKPLSPIEIALRKAEKLKEKSRSLNLPPPPAANVVQAIQQQQSDMVQQQQIIQTQATTSGQQHMHQHQQTTAIVVQQSPQIGNQQAGIQQVTQIMQANSRTVTQSGSIQVHQPQIVKAIVAPTGTSQTQIVTSGQIQQISHAVGSGNPQIQLQQSSQMQSNSNITPSSVSVVLTTPVTAPLTVSQGAQIVSIQPQTSTTSIISQAQNVQTITSHSIPQLATVGTVLTTAATLQPSANVTTLNTSALRAQRLVSSGALQEVVLQQRPNTQSPTIVSMSGIGGQQSVNPQFQATQLRFSMAGGQQVSGIVAKGISLQQAGKLTGTNQPAQILYRQQALRQQLKVLQTGGQPGQAAAVVQTAGGQTALVNASGAIIQGSSSMLPAGQVQVQGQKVSIATVTAAGSSGTSVATVQVAPGQTKTQLIKQFGGKVNPRQGGEGDMLLLKRQIPMQQQQKVIPQAQLFTSNVQVQQAGASNQQQIATLVKTSSGSITTSPNATAVGMALSQIKPGQIKVTMANQNQVRQLQLQQQLAISQQRKAGKMAQITQVQQKAGGVPTQLIVQNPKNIPGVTVQQFQQVIRHAPPGISAAAGQIVLGKTSVGRVIPVSVASQANTRQTIQVVSAASAQAIAQAGNIRAHVTGTQNIGTIKVAAGTQAQTQQAIINALQSQQNQRQQNPSPVRLQTTAGGSLVAVTVQQQNTPSDSQQQMQQQQMSQTQNQQQIPQHQQGSSQQQQTTQQQVRTLVKKKIMSIRNEKEQQ